jgi:hypothetical protein
METPIAAFENLFEKAQSYGMTTYELNRLKAIETTASVATSVVSRMAVVLVAAICMMVLNIGIAMLIGDAIGHNWAGFMVVAAFYMVVAIILHFFLQTWLRGPIGDRIIANAMHA